MGKPTKQDVRRGYIFVIIVIFIVYAIFAAMSPNSMKAKRTYVKVFYNLEDTWIAEDKLTEVLTPEKQKSFVSAIYDMQQKARKEKNEALVRLDWIDFNKNTLCEKFNYVFQPQDWLVRIKEVDIYDSGSAIVNSQWDQVIEVSSDTNLAV